MGQTIMIVDDSAVVRATVRATLQSIGFEVAEAKDGVDGLNTLHQLQSHDKSLSMIITDVNMPNMDGITFIKEVKKTPWKILPILVLTTLSQDEKKMEGKKAGASGWIVKPFREDQLINVIRKFIKN